MTTTLRTRALSVLAALALLVPAARAQDDSPHGWRDLQSDLREAMRDTVGRGEDPDRLGALGAMLLKLGRLGDAEKVLRRVVAVRPSDRPALAGLGKIALFHHRDAEAESLLVAAGGVEGAARDLYAAYWRRGDWKDAAGLAETVEDPGAQSLLERLQEPGVLELLPGPAEGALPFDRAYPVPLVRAKLAGQTVSIAFDPGCPNVIVDPVAARLVHLTLLPGERAIPWLGSRVASRSAIAPKIEIAGIAFANVPVAIVSLHRYSLDVNPQGRDIAMVVGRPLLERLGLTIDFQRQKLELRRPETKYSATGVRVPFEQWSDNQLVVWGSIGGARRLSMALTMSLPGAGFGGPAETFDELGLRAGRMSNLMKGAGVALQGRPWAQAGVPTLALGSIVGDRVSGWIGSMDPGEAWRSGVRLDGQLGPDWFRGRRVTFDWTRHEMVFEGS